MQQKFYTTKIMSYLSCLSSSNTRNYEEDDVEEKENDRHAGHRHCLYNEDHCSACICFYEGLRRSSCRFLVQNPGPGLKNLARLRLFIGITGTMITFIMK